MAKFSDRQGITAETEILQIDSINAELRNSLWNALASTFSDVRVLHDSYERPSDGYRLIRLLWLDYFKRPIDELPQSWAATQKILKYVFLNSDWFEVYNFIEAVFKVLVIIEEGPRKRRRDLFHSFCNQYLEREMSAYRVMNSCVVPITSAAELKSVTDALQSVDKFKPVAVHLDTAVTLISDKTNPDYRNSIKESISAVEAICQIITGSPKVTLGQALKALEGRGVNVHPALRQGFEKLYGWTSNAEGIRHALLEESHLSFEDAKFMLVTCSAFVNFLKANA